MFDFSILLKKVSRKISWLREGIRRKKEQELVRALLAKSGGMVYSGPFATMPIPDDCLEANERYFIVGSYEECIHSEVYNLILTQPKYGVIVGAHKGYYVAGFLHTVQNCFITAFESSKRLHSHLISWSQAINAAERLEIKGFADLNTLINLKSQPDFLIIDCEGGEDELLQPDLVPWLSKTFIICELHDFHKPGLLGRLIPRFLGTHDIKIIESQESDPKSYAILADLSPTEAKKCVHEERWIYSPESLSRILTGGRFMVASPK